MSSASSIDICHILLTNQSILTSTDIDLTGYIEEAFQQVLTKTDQRQHAFHILTMFYQPLSTISNITLLTPSQQQALKRLFPILDRLTSWIENIHIYELSMILPFLRLIIQDMKYPELINYWNQKVIQKVIPLLMRLIGKSRSQWEEIDRKVQQVRHNKNMSSSASTSTSASSYSSLHGKRPRYQELSVNNHGLAGPTVVDHQQQMTLLYQLEQERDRLVMMITFYLEIFELLLTASHLRAHLLPHTKTLREMLSMFMIVRVDNEEQTTSGGSSGVGAHFISTVINVMALVTSLETAEIWAVTTQIVILEMIHCLQKLSVPLLSSLVYSHLTTLQQHMTMTNSNNNNSQGVHGNGAKIQIQVIDWKYFDQWSVSVATGKNGEEEEIHGITRALWMKSIFDRLTRVLAKIFAFGCSSGFVSFDLTALFALSSGLLPLGVDANTSDPANFIENQHHVSVVDIAFVLTQLKVSLLHPMKTLLQLNLVPMIRYGGLCIQPVMNLLSRKESMAVPSLLFTALDYLSVAMSVLPATMALVINHGATILLDLFGLQIQQITMNRNKMAASSAVLTSHVHALSASSLSTPTSGLALISQGKLQVYEEEDIEIQNDQLAIKILNTMESLLIHCSALLNPLSRQTIEQLIQQALQVMELGLFSYTVMDRRFKRIHQVERIRYSIRLQKAMISLALAEVIAASKTGMISMNVIPLRSVCQGIVKSTSTGDDSSGLLFEAKRIILVLGQILYPSAIAIPMVSPADLAGQYLVKLRQQAEDSIQGISSSGAKIASRKPTSVTLNETSTGEEVTNKTNKKKRDVTAMKKDHVVVAMPSMIPSSDVAQVPKQETQVPAVLPALNLPIACNTSKEVEANDDEDSVDDIPDLDLEDD